MTTTNSKAQALAQAKAAALQAKLAAKATAQDAAKAERDVALAHVEAVEAAAKTVEPSFTAGEAQVTASKEMLAMNKLNKLEQAKEKAAAKAERQAARDAAKADRKASKDKAAAERDAHKAAVKSILSRIKAIKAKGAKATDADKAELRDQRAALAAVRVSPGKKVDAMLEKAMVALNVARRLAARYERVDVPDEGGLALIDVLNHKIELLGALRPLVRQTAFVKPVKAKVAKVKAAKAPKVELQVGSLVVLVDKVRETYEDLLDPAGEFRVVKVVGKKAVIVGNDGIRSILPAAHLKVEVVGG
jgi:hypothetical protein